MYQMIIIFMTADNSFLTGPKRGENSSIGFKASIFCVKLAICKHIRKFCELYLLRKQVINISLSIYLLSTDQILHFFRNFVNDSKLIEYLSKVLVR